MFSKNLKYHRLKNRLSKKALAEKAGISPMAITHYENGNRTPDMNILKALAGALGIRVTDFLMARNGSLVFRHGEFSKNPSLTSAQQEYVRESVEEYFDRFMAAVEILGGEVLPDAPACSAIVSSEDDEENASALRRHLGFAPDGPVENLIGKLENKGIPVFECHIDNPSFYGMNGFVNDRPYIVLNPGMSPERKRSTAAHELAHLMFAWPEDIDGKEIENRATGIGGAFLLPRNDAVRELGIRRASVSSDFALVAREYGISMMTLTERARICGIISDAAERKFRAAAGKRGWPAEEPSRIGEERPGLFEQLVFRAVNEGEINIQRGAELLRKPYPEIAAMSCFGEA